MKPFVSIVITCHNYAQYVAQATASALSQTYPHTEVIVVDDGSTDDSVAKLARFAGRITLIRQENRGHVGAVSRGFTASGGDIVLFLDADDLLRREAIERVVAAWQPDCSKVQFELDVMDGAGTLLGRRFCNYVEPYDAAEIEQEFACFGTYVWPVLSGNAYSRSYLERLMPLPVARAPDGYLNTLAPLYGSVRVVHASLGVYRLHESNQSYQGERTPEAASRFVKRVSLRTSEFRHLSEHARALLVQLPPGNLLDQELPFVNYRLMLKRLGVGYEGAEQDSALRLWHAGLKILLQRPLPARMKLAHGLWLSALLCSPRALARAAITLRFNRAALFKKHTAAAVMPTQAGTQGSVLLLATRRRGHDVAARLTPLISVIIPNYNYAPYLRAAVDSALNLDWPRVEVIVIDDGSTDESRAILASYGSRITTLLQENSGQLVACNKGLVRARGEIIVFLDSDDVLDPAFAREVMRVWTPTTSKVQVQMRSIDAQGRPSGSIFPQYARVPKPEQIRVWATHSAAYPTPPGSGNAYARAFLEKIFPLRDTCGTANDSYCVAAAPFLGDVTTIAQPLVSYRVHGRNQGALLNLDARQFARQVTRARLRRAYAKEIAATVGMDLRLEAVDRSLTYLCYRIASLRAAPASHPIANDSKWRCLRDLSRAFFAPQGVSFKGRVSILGWAWAVCLLPDTWSHRLILWRFAPSARPTALRNLLIRLHVVRA